MGDEADIRLVEGWFAAIRRPQIAAALEAIYADVASAIAERGPACWASGRCCNFEKTGHRLYATGLETAYTLTRHAGDERVPERIPGSASRTPSELAERSSSMSSSLAQATTAMPRAAPLTHATLDDALTRGGCPFQVLSLCGVHPIRPLGCRVYFCDRSAQEWQKDLYERSMDSLRRLHDEHAIEYRYGEWRAMLRMFVNAG